MKKIVLITECMEKGVGKHVVDLYKNLKKDENIKIYVLYGKNRASEEYKNEVKEDSIELLTLERNIGIKDIKSFFEIRKILKEIKPDVVHCHSSKAGFSGRIAAKSVKVKKIIYSPHAYFFLKYNEKSLKRKIFIVAEKILSKLFTTKTITTSKGEDDAFIKYKIDKEDKRILIEHGIEVKEFSKEQIDSERKKYNVLEDDIFIGAMARFEEQKDPIGTYEILKRISNKNKKVKCVFWGNGSLYKEVKKLNEQVNNIVNLPGETTTPEINLSSLDIYLTASLYEGLPYTLLTSLAYGLPIVASNVEGNKDCVFENKNGCLFEAKDYENAICKIETLLKDNKFEKMRKESLNIFKNRFSIDNMIKKYRSLYIDE